MSLHFAFRYARASTKHISILLSTEKILQFLRKPMIRVPARKLHARPGYINTRILTGLLNTQGSGIHLTLTQTCIFELFLACRRNELSTSALNIWILLHITQLLKHNFVLVYSEGMVSTF